MNLIEKREAAKEARKQLKTDVRLAMGLFSLSEASEALDCDRIALMRLVSMGKLAFNVAHGEMILSRDTIQLFAAQGCPGLADMPENDGSWFKGSEVTEPQFLRTIKEDPAEFFRATHSGSTFGVEALKWAARRRAAYRVQNKTSRLFSKDPLTTIEKIYSLGPDNYRSFIAEVSDHLNGKQTRINGEMKTISSFLGRARSVRASTVPITTFAATLKRAIKAAF